MTPRATPLPPDERRRAILAAALPLVRERGFDVSTAEIARAADIAEGTLFRAFPTKADLLRALVADATDPAADIAALDAVDRSLPLADKVSFVIAHWRTRIAEVSVMMAALMASTAGRREISPFPRGPEDAQRQADALNQAVTRLLEPDAAQLRVSPTTATTFIRSAIFAATHPLMSPGDGLTDAQLLELLLHGVLADPAPADPTESDEPC